MSEIVLDMGSGNSNTDYDIGARLIDTVVDMDSHKHRVVMKYQLWHGSNPQGANKMMSWPLFEALFNHADHKGYQVTSSVFDEMSLQFLLTFHPCFVKLANRPDTWHLLGDVPRRIPVYISNYPEDCGFRGSGIVTSLACISKYPATIQEYETIPYLHKFFGISDHTMGLELWEKYHPTIFEKHVCLERSADNLDSGLFSMTPDELGGLIA